MISLVTHTRKFSMAPRRLRDEATSLLPSTMGPGMHTERPGPGRWESKEDLWEEESKLDENELDDQQHLLRPQTEQSRSSKEEAPFKVGSLPRVRVCACGICPRIVQPPQDELCPHTTLAPHHQVCSESAYLHLYSLVCVHPLVDRGGYGALLLAVQRRHAHRQQARRLPLAYARPNHPAPIPRGCPQRAGIRLSSSHIIQRVILESIQLERRSFLFCVSPLGPCDPLPSRAAPRHVRLHHPRPIRMESRKILLPLRALLLRRYVLQYEGSPRRQCGNGAKPAKEKRCTRHSPTALSHPPPHFTRRTSAPQLCR